MDNVGLTCGSASYECGGREVGRWGEALECRGGRRVNSQGRCAGHFLVEGAGAKGVPTKRERASGRKGKRERSSGQGRCILLQHQ